MTPRLDGINLNLLLALDVLLAELNVTRAARRLGITQSAMSHSLAALREIFDDPLLVRTKTGMGPTEKATRLGPRLRQCLEMLQQTLSAAPDFDPASAQGAFSIATGDFLMLKLGRELMVILAQESPRTELRLLSLRGGQMHDSLLAQESDIVIGPELPTEGGICSRPVLTDPFTCALRVGHPLLKNRKSERLSMDEFLAWQHLLISPSGRGDAPVDVALRAQHLQRRIAVRVSSFLAAAEIVATSDLVLTAPRSSIEGSNLAILGAPMTLAPLKLCAYWDARRDRDPRLVWLRDRVVSILVAPEPLQVGTIHALAR